ncbi:MAG: replication protein P, partial [Sodalis sp. (in: enterobacteria)]|uniref:replication protein P n=1 Tax=Sodalis sp. (in: enterobacteria) TaxID=1898979 RepID=UPI0039E24F91
GLAMARKTASPFLPSPGQFIEWCLQGNLQHAGLPTGEQLYSEFLTYCKRRGDYESAEDYPWKSAALYWLVTDLFDDMRRHRLTDEEVRKKSELLLLKMEKRLGLGDVILAPVKRIASPRHPAGPTPDELLYAKYQQHKEAGLI